MHVIVVGLGGMGSAIAAHLSRRGHEVTGVDRFSPPHDRGSSHGRTRIIRQAYFEGPVYVPLLQRAYELWSDLETRSGRDLMRLTGGLMIGPPDSEVVVGARTSAEEHGLAHEVLTPGEVARRFPPYALEPHEVAVYEDVAGILHPEGCVSAHLEAAARGGATLLTGQTVRSWEVDGDGVTVRTASQELRGDRVVFAAGAWLDDVLPGLVPTSVERMVVVWFRPAPGTIDLSRLPVFLAHGDGEVASYGTPPRGEEGVKVAFHHGGRTGHPDELSRTVGADEVDAVRALAARRLPGLADAPAEAGTCLYTNTPDDGFVIGVHPTHEEVIVAGGFSGHGFKFCAVVGEVVADIVEDRDPGYDLSPFDPRRFAS